MSDSGEVEGVPSAALQFGVLPKEVASELGSVKLFNKWTYDDIEIRDMSLEYVGYPFLFCSTRLWAAVFSRSLWGESTRNFVAREKKMRFVRLVRVAWTDLFGDT